MAKKTNKRRKAKRITKKQHCFAVRIDADLFQKANAARETTWPVIIEKAMAAVIAAKVIRDEQERIAAAEKK